MRLFSKSNSNLPTEPMQQVNRVGRAVLAFIASLMLIGTGGVAAYAVDGSDDQSDRKLGNIATEATPLGTAVSTDDYGALYLESIEANPDVALETVGYDDELGVEIFDSPLGEFYVDDATADEAIDYDPLGVDPVIIPGIGEVEFIVADVDINDLSIKALADFESAEVDIDQLFASSETAQRSATALPDAALIRAAGACDVGLGENAMERLQECADAGGVDATSLAATDEEPPGEVAARVTTASPPSGCASASSVKYISRTTGCMYNTRKSNLVNRSGSVIGSITIAGVAYVSTRTDNTTKFNNTAYIRISARTGVANGRTFNFKGKTICGFNCMSPTGNESFAATSSWKSMTGTVTGDIGGGQSRKVISAWEYSITSPGIAFSGVFNTLAVQPRCDSNTPQLSGKGCVFPSVVPVFKLSRTGAASGVATHVQKAINSGLASNLTRASSATIAANRNKACPSSLKRDTGYQCDEYPFASSNQGAASGGTARVFSGCRWTAVAGSGSRGFSRCQVLTTQNQAGGRLLTSFYSGNRVMVNDKYKVQIS